MMSAIRLTALDSSRCRSHIDSDPPLLSMTTIENALYCNSLSLRNVKSTAGAGSLGAGVDTAATSFDHKLTLHRVDT